MKTIGLLGGMSWESTQLYYRIINEETKRRRGGLHSAPLAMVSVDFAEMMPFKQNSDWEGCGNYLAERARRIESAGADLLLICTNTMHRVAPQVEAAVDIPLVHIADATAMAIRDAGLTTVGLLGTTFTMEGEFYRDRIARHGIEVVVPDPADRAIVHRVIYDELCQGKIDAGSRQEFLRIIHRLQETGAEGIIAGCTEIGLLVDSSHATVPIFDTAEIHARHAVELALA